MTARRTVGAKGQVVIPKDMRQQLGIAPGSGIIFEIRDGELVVRPQRDSVDAVKEYVSIVKEKLRQEVDLDEVLGEEARERLDISGQ